MDPAISELLSFFDFAHLPPHLVEASRPFHEVAHALAHGNHRPMVDLYARPPYMPGAEGAEAWRKISQIHDAMRNGRAAISGVGPILRTLLEAKDCAVRAALVRHRAAPIDAAGNLTMDAGPGATMPDDEPHAVVGVTLDPKPWVLERMRTAGVGELGLVAS